VVYNDYDAMAEGYSAHNESNAFNAYYERPAVLRMLGDVRDADVLDVGCGAGAHALELRERGARVTGVDTSRRMLDLASERLGQDVPLICTSIEERLPFVDDSFDAILASLVMHYVEDWARPLSEFRRVLRGSGRLVISTHHPFMDHVLAQGESYLRTYSFTEEWEHSGRRIAMRFWHRPLSAIVAALLDAGFTIAGLEEPMPEAKVRQKDPRAWRMLTTEPRFVFFLAR
jgi:SAM-dependent methyltransferase